MPIRQLRNLENRQWRMLLVYDLYRILSIVLFMGIYSYNFSYKPQSLLFCTTLFIYFICTLIFLYFWHSKSLTFDKQVFLSGTSSIYTAIIKCA